METMNRRQPMTEKVKVPSASCFDRGVGHGGIIFPCFQICWSTTSVLREPIAGSFIEHLVPRSRSRGCLWSGSAVWWAARLYLLTSAPIMAPIWGAISGRSGWRSTLIRDFGGQSLQSRSLDFCRVTGPTVVARHRWHWLETSHCSGCGSRHHHTGRSSRGMGIIGMAIGLGFILGPAIGGGFYTLFPMESVGWETGLAINPFSVPAMAATTIAVLNFLWVLKGFQETLPPESRGRREGSLNRTWNPFGQLRQLNAPGLSQTNLSYFIYLLAFSAMEFTLTFLAVDILLFEPVDNTWMFVYIGLIIAIVQGGIVRRVVPKYGERKISTLGITIMLPGFCRLNHFPSVVWRVGSMTGSALAMPCLRPWSRTMRPKMFKDSPRSFARAQGSRHWSSGRRPTILEDGSRNAVLRRCHTNADAPTLISKLPVPNHRMSLRSEHH